MRGPRQHLQVTKGVLSALLGQVDEHVHIEQVAEAAGARLGAHAEGGGTQRPGLDLGQVDVPQGEHGQGLEQLPRLVIVGQGEDDGGLVGLGVPWRWCQSIPAGTRVSAVQQDLICQAAMVYAYAYV